MGTDDLSFLEGPAAEAAPQLLGCVLEREVGGRVLRGRIVETEAYDQTDVASHSYKGRTPRTEVMFGPAGRLYVYFTYGMHYCCNIVSGPDGHGAAVLLRALDPLDGEDVMQRHRAGRAARAPAGRELTNGPAKLCQALAIDRRLNGPDLRTAPLRLIIPPGRPTYDIARSGRIGISRGQDVPWRFYIQGDPYVSKP
jgi:DNA-3-methyladenine glycosylase